MRVRPPAVAGLFYPGDPDALRRAVDGFLTADAGAGSASGGDGGAAGEMPKALVVPHAGYVYSGAVAGHGYARALPAAASIRRVVLLGPCHRVPVRGLALPGADALATPLGEVPVDADAAAGLPHVTERPDVHEREHSLEVQLPFLQRAFPDAAVLPFAVGQATPEQVAEVLEAVAGGDETLIVVSSDLSHYHPYAQARDLDAATLDAVLALQRLDHDQACGASPLNGLQLYAQRHGLHPVLVDACNSGDTAGDKDRVVGYASVAYYAGPASEPGAGPARGPVDRSDDEDDPEDEVAA